ncbi:MAG: hypothetical protein WCL14_08305 [Bacteroidota bacterium]
MKTYLQCPNCHQRGDATVYQCAACGKFMCYYNGFLGIGSYGCYVGNNCIHCGAKRRVDGKRNILKVGEVDAWTRADE